MGKVDLPLQNIKADFVVPFNISKFGVSLLNSIGSKVDEMRLIRSFISLCGYANKSILKPIAFNQVVQPSNKNVISNVEFAALVEKRGVAVLLNDILIVFGRIRRNEIFDIFVVGEELYLLRIAFGAYPLDDPDFLSFVQLISVEMFGVLMPEVALGEVVPFVASILVDVKGLREVLKLLLISLHEAA